MACAGRDGPRPRAGLERRVSILADFGAGRAGGQGLPANLVSPREWSLLLFFILFTPLPNLERAGFAVEMDDPGPDFQVAKFGHLGVVTIGTVFF